ncbi:hypothetical protein EDB86DRAFT_2829413 [Lactarius hatsudake]|nr:hypothetical protein EDB86DRAFT_2829413 [Lactarius hatsudake]
MCEIIDNQKTPKKFQPVKRAIVISPASEVPAKRQQRRTSAAAKAAAKAIGHLPNPSHGVSECLPQTDAPKVHVCQMCKIRKVPCNPPPKWAIPQIEAKQQAAKVKQDNMNHKCSAATIMEDLPLTLDGLKTRLDSMETNFTAFQEAMDMRMGALQDITPSTLTLCIPPVPLFEQGAPPPSPTPGPSSIASTISSTLSAGFDISQLSITAPLLLWPWAVVPDRLIPLHHYLALQAMGKGGAAIKPPSRAPSATGRSSRTWKDQVKSEAADHGLAHVICIILKFVSNWRWNYALFRTQLGRLGPRTIRRSPKQQTKPPDCNHLSSAKVLHFT